jgi:hypothetical protein
MEETNSIFMEIPVTINGVYAIYCMINMTLNVTGIQTVENPTVFPVVIKPALQIPLSFWCIQFFS